MWRTYYTKPEKPVTSPAMFINQHQQWQGYYTIIVQVCEKRVKWLVPDVK